MIKSLFQTLDWITNFAQNRNLSVVLHAKTFITLLFSLISRCKSESSLFDSLAVQLCHIFGTINEVSVLLSVPILYIGLITIMIVLITIFIGLA